MKRIFYFWLFLLSSVGHAVPVSGLYSSVVQVPGSLDDRQLLERAFSESIDDVLIRVSGTQDNLSSSILNRAHQSAASWVAQHSIKDVVEMVNGANGPEAAKEVSVSFYKESVDRFLFENNLPVWESNRPSILVWMIEENNGVRQMSGANQPSSSLSLFFDGAKQLGLPAYAPLADKVDNQTLGNSALWGFFEGDILSASQRYQTDIVLALRVSEYQGESVVDCMLLLPNQASRIFSVTRMSKSDAIAELLSKLASLLSDRYASINMGTPNQINVLVDGVSDYRSFSEVDKYLSSVGVVKQVQLGSIINGGASFELLLNGTEEKFINSVALNSVLVEVASASSEGVIHEAIEYKYAGDGVK